MADAGVIYRAGHRGIGPSSSLEGLIVDAVTVSGLTSFRHPRVIGAAVSGLRSEGCFRRSSSAVPGDVAGMLPLVEL